MANPDPGPTFGRKHLASTGPALPLLRAHLYHPTQGSSVPPPPHVDHASVNPRTMQMLQLLVSICMQARRAGARVPHVRPTYPQRCSPGRAAASLCLTLYAAPTLRTFGNFAVWLCTQFAVEMLTVHRRFAGARLDGAAVFVPGRRQPDDQRPEERLAAGAPAPPSAFASCRRQTRRCAPPTPSRGLSTATHAVARPVNVLRVRLLRRTETAAAYVLLPRCLCGAIAAPSAPVLSALRRQVGISPNWVAASMVPTPMCMRRSIALWGT